MNNTSKKSIKKSESLPVELGLITLRDALLSRRACVLESTLNEVSYLRTTILDQENGAYSPSSSFSSLLAGPSTPLATHEHPSPPATHTAPLTANRVNVTSIGTQTHCHLCTNTTTAVGDILRFSSVVSSSTDLLATNITNDRLNVTNDTSPLHSPPSCL